jgi:hypothetical protein
MFTLKKENLFELWLMPNKEIRVGFEVLTEPLGTKMAVFWVVAPCCVVDVYQRFRGPCCLHHHTNRSEDGDSKDL